MFAHRNEDGHYTWDGEKLPSVTTIIGMLGSEALSMWYAKMAAQEAAQRIADGDLDGASRWEDVMKAPIRYRDYKGQIGSVFHHAMQTHVLAGLPQDLDEFCIGEVDRLGYGRGLEDGYLETLGRAAARHVRQGVKWLDAEKPEFLMVGLEAVVVSKRHGYAGSADWMARIKGEVVLGDWKTSNHLWTDRVHHQMEAYASADFIGDLNTGEELELPAIDSLLAVHVTEDSCKGTSFPRSPEVFDSFLAMREVYGVLNAMPKPMTSLRRGARKAKAPKECPF